MGEDEFLTAQEKEAVEGEEQEVRDEAAPALEDMKKKMSQGEE